MPFADLQRATLTVDDDVRARTFTRTGVKIDSA